MLFNAKLMEDMSVLWFETPMVVSARMQAMTVSAMTGGLQDPGEMNRMISEKFAAASESVEAMSRAIFVEGLGAAVAMTTGKCAELAGAADRVTSAAIKPYVNRVRANASRLANPSRLARQE